MRKASPTRSRPSSTGSSRTPNRIRASRPRSPRRCATRGSRPRSPTRSPRSTPRSCPTSTGEQTFTIDGHALSGALHDALAPNDPQLAAQLRTVPPLDVQIKANDMPHLHDPRSTADVVTVLAIMAALLLITASLILRTTGGRSAGSGAGPRTSRSRRCSCSSCCRASSRTRRATRRRSRRRCSASTATACCRRRSRSSSSGSRSPSARSCGRAHPSHDAMHRRDRPPPYTGPEPPRALGSRPISPRSPRRCTCSAPVAHDARRHAHDRDGLGDAAHEDRAERFEVDVRVARRSRRPSPPSTAPRPGPRDRRCAPRGSRRGRRCRHRAGAGSPSARRCAPTTERRRRRPRR